MTSPKLDYTWAQHPEPHLERTRQLIKAHPEVRALFGPVRWTALLVVAGVAAQVLLAWALLDEPWWAIVAGAWLVGAFIDHMLWVLIHESAHNLVFRSSRTNQLLAIVANLPILFPSAVSFRKYHLLHHRYQGDPSYDADLASPLEAKLVGNVWWRKALWLLFFFAAQSTRVGRLTRVPFWDRWYVLNLAVEVAFIGTTLALLGPWALAYLFLASIFAIGLHPVGARWIQEHYLTTDDGQETYSYYGPLNIPSLNVGYHNEHHDVMRVPWMRLPRVRAMAPEFYESLTHHTSWGRLLLRFIFDSRLSLYSRIVRTSAVAGAPPSVKSIEHVEELASAA